MPTGRLEGRPKVAAQALLASSTVIQKKAVDTTHPVVVQVVDHGNFERKSLLVDGGGKTVKDVMDQPEVEFSHFLVSSKAPGYRQVVKRTKRSADPSPRSRTKKLFCGSQEILDIVFFLESIPNPVHRVFFPPGIKVAAENLEDS